MTVNNIKTTPELQALSKSELGDHILCIQSTIQEKLNKGRTMDEILDAENPFELIEPMLPREVYPIFLPAIINDIKTDTVMDTILDALEEGLSRYGNDIENGVPQVNPWYPKFTSCGATSRSPGMNFGIHPRLKHVQNEVNVTWYSSCRDNGFRPS